MKLAKLSFGRDLVKAWKTEGNPENLPFYELLWHSDCDGELSPEECQELLKDFKDLEKKKDTLTWYFVLGGNFFNWWWKKFLLWKEAVEHSVRNECTLIFC